MTPRPARTRSDALTALADAVNELVEASTHTERYQRDARSTETATTRRGRVTARRVTRAQTLTTNVPSLLTALREACVPSSSQEQNGASGGAFESKPPAEVAALSALREIRDQAAFWAEKHFRIDISRYASLYGLLPALVSAASNATEEQLTELAADATRWVRVARLAVGIDAPPVTVEDRCPICGARFAVVIHGLGLAPERQHAACTRCGVAWSPDQLGILAEMLRANREQETMTS